MDRNGLLKTVASSYGIDVWGDYAIGDPFTDPVAAVLDADLGWLALTVDQTPRTAGKRGGDGRGKHLPHPGGM